MENTKPASISRSKLFGFKVAAALLPLAALLLLEGVLRISGYGKDYRLFIDDPERPGYRIMNPDVSEKYFLDARNATVGYFEPFPAEKGPETLRLIVMGASTAVGFPYLHNGSFHRMLRYHLSERYPDRTVEVINVALTGINSYALLDFTGQVIALDPDAVLIYAGHNEYYGTLGVASRSHLGQTPSLVRLALTWREARLGQWLSRVFRRLTARGADQAPDLRENLMRRLAEGQIVPYGSPVYLAGLHQFRENMARLLQRFRHAGIPVLLSTVVSNERDQAPLYRGARSESDSLATERDLWAAERAWLAGRGEEALRLIHRALQLDSTLAEAHFLRGRVLASQGDHRNARSAYRAARRHDQLRFRAPEAINRLIDSLAAAQGAQLVDMEGAFRNAAPHGIPGKELFLEHLHPNLQGYRLMARTWLEALHTSNLLPPPREGNARSTAVPGDANAIPRLPNSLPYPLTEVDSLYGAYTTIILKQGWPFFENIEVDTSNRSFPEAIAGALAVRQISWDQAMDRLYQHYRQAGRLEDALTVARAAILAHPEESAFYAKAGSLCLRQKDYPSGQAFFDAAQTLEAKPEYLYYAALCRLHNHGTREALAYLDRAGPDLTASGRSGRLRQALRQTHALEEKLNREPALAEARYQLAGLYHVLGLEERAKEELTVLLSKGPGHPAARQLLESIEAQTNSQ